MTNKPTHRAYIVQERKRDDGTANAKFIEIGAVWPHSKGIGFDVVIPEGLSVTGRLVVLENKPKEGGGDT